MSSTKFNKMFAIKTTSLTLVLFAIILVTIFPQQFVSCEQDSASTSGSMDQSQASEFGNPKRQYLIAPRIGRSGNMSPALWSALEEAAFTIPAQVQAQRGSQNPQRTSLLFLVGNRRMIGPRSGGLLPQARIGRRSTPIGLMPQPRVGRRSMVDLVAESGGEPNGESDNHQEVAMATLSDTSPVNDVLESLMSN